MNQLASDRVWEGDERTVRENSATTPYDPYNPKIVLDRAVLLYSFRDSRAHRMELIGIRTDLREAQQEIVSPHADTYFGSHWADRVDMLTTYYRWFSQQKEIDPREREQFELSAMSLCINSLPAMKSELMRDPARSHTYYLVQTTNIWLAPHTKDSFDALELIGDQVSARTVSNPHQLARIYCRLGILYNLISGNANGWFWYLGFYWGFKAVIAPGISLRERAKYLAAVAGYGY